MKNKTDFNGFIEKTDTGYFAHVEYGDCNEALKKSVNWSYSSRFNTLSYRRQILASEDAIELKCGFLPAATDCLYPITVTLCEAHLVDIRGTQAAQS